MSLNPSSAHCGAPCAGVSFSGKTIFASKPDAKFLDNWFNGNTTCININKPRPKSAVISPPRFAPL